MRIGILGGTFDPVHNGHLDVAHAASRALHLDEVWLVPCRVPSHRSMPHASAAHRFAMTALAASSFPNVLVSDLEMTSEAPAYTVDTLDRLASRGIDMTQIFLITGADAFADIRTWRAFPAVLDRCHFAVVSRPDRPVGALPSHLPELAPHMVTMPAALPGRPAILLIDAPTAAVSSTDVRRLAAAHESITGLVPPPVQDYISKHHLYSVDAVKGLA
ncbi:MAG TPA: nicotinate-nucleotide adenylyltransferase [Vicinamibacterales bacterium]|nr:nicotinate-nucleotide adenylyltransferase [Vicinamibacterales bacterium]